METPGAVNHETDRPHRGIAQQARSGIPCRPVAGCRGKEYQRDSLIFIGRSHDRYGLTDPATRTGLIPVYFPECHGRGGTCLGPDDESATKPEES